MSGIEITRRDLTATELRMAAGRTKDSKASRRMLALALVLDGVDRTRAAGLVVMSARVADRGRVYRIDQPAI